VSKALQVFSSQVMNSILISIFICTYRFALLGVVDTASACVFNTFSFCLGFGLFSLLPNAALSACVATWIALMVSFVLSSCLEGVIFALFTRPYDVGDTILLVS